MTNAADSVYAFAVLRAVPHVYLGGFANVGVIVHAPTADFLAMRVVTDRADLKRRAPEADVEVLARYLESCRAICAGDAAAGPLALAAPSERFHSITAPRSDVLQSSPVHEGLGDPRRALDELFEFFVGTAQP
ncbi:MAG TPA: DUF3037 domain-containing protein [Longimicrobiales bacterium]|nr:DUF3037 domain-containing protein [Longimicrobiales bacterium]